MANEDPQGIIVYERSIRPFGNRPWAVYFPSYLQHKYDSYVKKGRIPLEDGTVILASEWLKEPLDELSITLIGADMEANCKMK